MTKNRNGLKLITNKEQKEKLEAPNDFLGCCPLKYIQYPQFDCKEGQKSINEENPPCDWWINSKEYQYCFWKFLEANSEEDGLMKTFTQAEISELFGWSDTRTYFTLKEATEEFKKLCEEYDIVEILSDLENNQ